MYLPWYKALKHHDTMKLVSRYIKCTDYVNAFHKTNKSVMLITKWQSWHLSFVHVPHVDINYHFSLINYLISRYSHSLYHDYHKMFVHYIIYYHGITSMHNQTLMKMVLASYQSSNIILTLSFEQTQWPLWATITQRCLFKAILIQYSVHTIQYSINYVFL